MSDNAYAPVDPLSPETEEFIANPYPALHDLRRRGSVWWSEKGRRWLVTGHPQAQQILRDRRFLKGMRVWRYLERTNQVPPELAAFIKARSKWMVNLDPPDHTRMRALVNKAFAPHTVAALSQRATSLADQLWEQNTSRRQAEVMSELASPFVMALLCEMLGVPHKDQAQFSLWARTAARLINTGRDLETENPNANSLRQYLSTFIQECQTEPKPGVISLLARNTEDREPLTFEEILDNCNLLLAAGFETTVNAIGNCIVTLLRNPDQFELLRAAPELVKSTIDEVLRYESPVQTLIEIAASDMTIDDAALKKGQNVVIIIGACNRDPSQFTDPDVFDIRRNQGKSLAFGEGIHHCLGSALAELLIGTFLRKLLEKAPDLRLADTAIKFRKPFGLRGPESVRVIW